MAGRNALSRKQFAVIEAMFSGELDEQSVLEKHKVSRSLYSKWQRDEDFVRQFEKRTATAYRRVVALIAGYAPLAAARLIQLTESEKEETARKACLDIISMPLAASVDAKGASGLHEVEHFETDRILHLPEQTVSKLLAVLAGRET